MIVLIAGATHTGKTTLAQRMTEKYKIPYLSVDLLKMGLIRSGNTSLTPYDDEELTPYLWNIVKEMIKTAIEDEQNLIVEGCYIPFDWQKDFDGKYLREIKYRCLVMSEKYIENRFDDIVKYESVTEKRMECGAIDKAELIKDNAHNLMQCKKYGLPYILIDGEYNADMEL